ncbi:MAG: TIGR02679 family protein [Selenomonadaceae bacterium]|nr:TIGR02679 family protein [Selenomonadaceae bacterium]
MSNKLAEEACSYFESHPVLMKLAKAFCRKYRSLGHFGGSLALPAMSSTERTALAAYLRRDVHSGDRLSYRDFAAAWEKTRFGAIPPEEFLLELMPKDFASKREERQREKEARQKIYEKLSAIHQEGYARRWLDALRSEELRLPQRDFYLRKELLGTVAKALASLPATCERLPFFANRVTGSPHGLDFDQEAGRIFLQALAYLRGATAPREADERTRLLYEFHLLRDDILNFATICGLTAYDETGREIAYWREAAENFSPLNIPFREIVRVSAIRPLKETYSVYIVENSGVFSTLLDKLQENRAGIPLIALHGQLKAASWALLDKLAASGAKLLYGGDYDPEGLSIANKLLLKYQNADLWHMSAEEYRRASQPLPEERLRKLPEPIHPKLRPLAEVMREKKKVLYQESLIEELEKDIVIKIDNDSSKMLKNLV